MLGMLALDVALWADTLRDDDLAVWAERYSLPVNPHKMQRWTFILAPGSRTPFA